MIGQLVVREIGSLILIAAVIGLPLAALAIQRYLAIYVEHAPIAMTAVARHAWIAMRMMPSDALRV